MVDHALSPLRVLDLSENIAGPYCTKLLAGFGADVVKVERSGSGDPLRTAGPFCEGRGAPPAGTDPDLERSIPFLWLNTSKRSIALDPARDTDTLRALIARADVVVESGGRALSEFGLDGEALRADNPRLIWTSISDFGLDGRCADWSGTELVWYAMAGGMYLTGDPAREPLGPGLELAAYSAAKNAYLGTLLALLSRVRTGEGQRVEVSIQEASIENVEVGIINYLRRGVVPKRAPHPMVPWDMYRTSDGWAALTCAPFRHFTKGLELFEEPRLLEEQYKHIRDRAPHRADVEQMIQPWLSRHTREEVFQAGQSEKLAWAYLAEPQEVMDSTQLRARDFFVESHHPVAGPHTLCGAPWPMSRTPWRDGRAPLLGEHGESVRSEWLAAAPPVQNAAAGGSAARPSDGEANGDGELPLSGVRVLDLSQHWAAPHGTRLLADFGADVIRVEYPKRMCMFRGGRTDEDMFNRHPMWAQISRGKRSLTLDLQDAGDAEALRKLVPLCDVVVDNARGGVMDALGLSPAELQALHPEVIVASAAAFGTTGPYATYGGYGALFEAMGGLQHATGYADRDKPARVKEVDVTNGIALACAIVTALVARQRTGHGQVVDCSQLEMAVHTLFGEQLLAFSMNGTPPRARGNRHPRHAPQGCYACSGEDRWLVLTVRDEAEWRALCDEIGAPEWADDPDFATPEGRRARHDEIDTRIEAWSGGREHREAAAALQARGVPAGPVFDMQELTEDPHLLERGFWLRPEHGESLPFTGIGLRLSKTPGRIAWPGPRLGEHDAEIRCGLLGEPPEAVKPIVPEELGTAFDP